MSVQNDNMVEKFRPFILLALRRTLFVTFLTCAVCFAGNQSTERRISNLCVRFMVDIVSNLPDLENDRNRFLKELSFLNSIERKLMENPNFSSKRNEELEHYVGLMVFRSGDPLPSVAHMSADELKELLSEFRQAGGTLISIEKPPSQFARFSYGWANIKGPVLLLTNAIDRSVLFHELAHFHDLVSIYHFLVSCGFPEADAGFEASKLMGTPRATLWTESNAQVAEWVSRGLDLARDRMHVYRDDLSPSALVSISIYPFLATITNIYTFRSRFNRIGWALSWWSRQGREFTRYERSEELRLIDGMIRRIQNVRGEIRNRVRREIETVSSRRRVSEKDAQYLQHLERAERELTSMTTEDFVRGWLNSPNPPVFLSNRGFIALLRERIRTVSD
jgi:hypothetical protein